MTYDRRDGNPSMDRTSDAVQGLSTHSSGTADPYAQTEEPEFRKALAIAAVLTAVFILVRGYSFGIGDHAIHLPFIQRAADPSFLTGDAMLALAPKHPSLFFEAFGLLARLIPIEPLCFAAYALSTFTMILAVRALAYALWPGPGARWVAALALAGVFVPHNVGGGIGNFDPLFLPRVASLGPLLFALVLCVRGRFLWAFALIGIVFLFHATTAAHTAALAWMACAFYGRDRIRDLVLGPLVFMAAASPLLFMMAQAGGSAIPTPAPAEWLAALKLQFPLHHFESVFVIASHALSGGLAVLLGILCSPWREQGRMLAGFLAGVLVMFAAGLVGNYILHSPFTIQLHVFQAGRMLDVLALVSLGWWTFVCFGRSSRIGLLSLIPTAAYVFRTPLYELHPAGDYPSGLHYVIVSFVVVTLLVTAVVVTIDQKMMPVQRDNAPGPEGKAAHPRFGIALGVLMVAMLAAAVSTGGSWQVTGKGLAGYRMMRWADAALPADAVVLVPPYLEEPVAAFRYFGGRRILGSWKDGGEGTFDYAFQMAWAGYVEDAFGRNVEAGTTDYPQLLRKVIREYHALSAERFDAIAGKYRVTHAVREADSPKLPFPELYRDDEYVLYRLQPDEAPPATR